MPRHCYVLRVFTQGDVGGNHLGVVTDVTGLDDAAMQSIATSLGFSETVFLDWRAGGVPHARIFTPGQELPFAGHPLVGAAWLLLRMGPGGPDRLACGIGEVGIRQEGELVWVDAPGDQPVEMLPELDLGGWAEAEEAGVVSLPRRYLVARLASPEEVAAVSPQAVPTRWGEVLVWAWEEPEQAVKARFFAPELAVPEDPATGSAAVALAAYLRRRGFPSGWLEVHQGAEMGSPSTIRLQWDDAGTSIGGTVRRDEVRELTA